MKRVIALSMVPYPFSQGTNRSIHNVGVELFKPGDPGLASADYFDNLGTVGNWTTRGIDMWSLNDRFNESSPMRHRVHVPRRCARVSYLGIAFITSLGAMFFASRRPKTASEAA